MLVIPLASEQRKKIAQALSNETTVTILQELGQQAGSATNLSDRLQLPLTTVKYSIDALLDAGLIQVMSVSLSKKRREIKHYTAVKRAIVFTPETTDINALKLVQRILPYFVVVLVSIPLAFVLRDFVYYFVSTTHEITLTPEGAAFYAFLAGSVFAIIALLFLKVSWMMIKTMKSQRPKREPKS